MTPLPCVWLMLWAAAPMADAWPYAARPLPEGGVEYRYDLTAVKRSGGTADAIDAWGEARVKAFLATLPREVRVKVGWAPLDLSLGRSPEARPLGPSYGAVSDGPMATVDPLGRPVAARLRPALHPDEPKVLLSAEAVAFEVRSLEDAALAAVELDAERLRRELWNRVASEALRRAAKADGDAREGAALLAARVLAASACLKPKRLADATRGAPEVARLAQAELEALSSDPTVRPMSAPWIWRSELACGWIRAHALARPFETSRAGASAVLTYLAVLDADPRLRALEATLRRRRDRFLGTPQSEPLEAWRALAKGDAAAALVSLGDFIEQLPVPSREPPGLMALSSTPFLAFEAALTPPERGALWDELAQAVQEGRLSPSAAMWPSAREAALVPLAAPDLVDGLQLDSGWRNVLKTSFAGLLGGATVARGGSPEDTPEPLERRQLVVRLEVPPWLEVEPLGSLYGRLADSLEALRAALAAEGLTGLAAVEAEGQGAALMAQVGRLVAVLRGLQAVAAGASAPAEAALARQFLSSWRREPALSRDVRRASAVAQPGGESRQHAVVLGVARRELSVGFLKPPQVEVLGGEEPFEVDSSARQKYLVPLLWTVPATAAPLTAPLDRAVVRGLVDSAGRDAAGAEAAVVEALHAVEVRRREP